jgi:hypothetical protein
MTEHRDSRGYVTVEVAADHPLANAGHSRRIGRHRLVLWEHLGRPDSTLCAICGYRLPWKRPDLANRAGRHVVNVDHINDVPGDDRVENLQPLCAWCNGARAQYGPAVVAWVAGYVGHIPPAQRLWVSTLVEELRPELEQDVIHEETDTEPNEPFHVRDALIGLFDDLEAKYS